MTRQRRKLPRGRAVTAFAAFALLVLAAGCGGRAEPSKDVPAEKVLLRAKYRIGDRYLLKTVAEQNIVQQRDAQSVEMKQTIRMELAMEVLSVGEEGTADTRVTYNRIALTQESPLTRLDYDSADPEKTGGNHPGLVGFKVLVGKSLTMKTTSRGEVKGVKGLGAIRDGLLREVPEGSARETAKRQLEQALSEEHFVEQMSSFGLVCPEHPVGVGDTWRQDHKVNMGVANVIVRNDFEVTAITPDSVKLALVAKMEDAGAAAGLPATVALKEGRQSGTVKVSRANAAVSTSSVNQHLEMSVTVQGRAMKQTLSSKTETTMELVPSR